MEKAGDGTGRQLVLIGAELVSMRAETMAQEAVTRRIWQIGFSAVMLGQVLHQAEKDRSVIMLGTELLQMTQRDLADAPTRERVHGIGRLMVDHGQAITMAGDRR